MEVSKSLESTTSVGNTQFPGKQNGNNFDQDLRAVANSGAFEHVMGNGPTK